jgi:succinate dehydrogenase/fumarate reductase flavoprotein subunit
VADRHAALADSGDRDIDVREFEYKVRRIIGDYVPSPKNAYKLNRWLEWSKVFKVELENGVRIEDGHDLARLYEVQHIIRCADCSAMAALAREESRWGDAHHRVDFPETDDANWLKHVIVRTGDQREHLNVSTAPILGLNEDPYNAN